VVVTDGGDDSDVPVVVTMVVVTVVDVTVVVMNVM
jgi:hypothetical protein